MTGLVDGSMKLLRYPTLLNQLEKNPFYTSTVVDSNYSNWADKYIHKNVILLSKSTESCHSLSQL